MKNQIIKLVCISLCLYSCSNTNQNSSSDTIEIEQPKEDKPDIVMLSNQQITNESKNFLSVNEFRVERSGLVTLFGQNLYEAKGKLIIRCNYDLYKRGNNIEGYWQTFTCYDQYKDESYNGWTSLYDYKFYRQGSLVSLDVTIYFQKYEQGWQIKSINK